MFYWQHARDSLLTPTALQIFQIACKHSGEDFEAACAAINAEYAILSGHGSQRHGGLFQTFVQVFQEAGWIDTSSGTLQITDTGHQAAVLMIKLPDFLKTAPYFLIELLGRYQLNNPVKPEVRKGRMAEAIQESDIFPYWTIWKVMRACEDLITTEELRRFVLQIQKTEQIDGTVDLIKAFRADKALGLSSQELDERYPAPLAGAVGEAKFIMARAGTQIGALPPLIIKPAIDSYKLSPAYLPFIDQLLANPPQFQENLTKESWLASYTRPISWELEYVPFRPPQGSLELSQEELLDDDPVLVQVKDLMEDGALSFLLSGPPGTSKSWYARRIASKLVNQDMGRVEYIQFHPSFGYEDFMEGYVPIQDSGSVPSFRLLPKVFLRAIERARDGSPFVLVIDEFTRGDAARIFGEALTYLEPSYRDHMFSLASGKACLIPRNLLIVATMNPYDRSVTDIDAAMLRRFGVIKMDPSEAMLRSLTQANGLDHAVIERLAVFFRYCQEQVPFGGLGHAYFAHVSNQRQLEHVWQYSIEPLFESMLRHEPGTMAGLRSEFAKVISA